MTSVQKFSDTSGSGSAGGGCGGQQQQQQSQAAAPSPDADAAACMLDLLLPDTVISILKLLADTPESIVAFSLSCSQAQQLCCDDARHLWLDLCRAITDTLPSQLRRVDWRPSAWGLDSHRELYICLLQPYRALLQQRVWHTAKMPAGQLLVVDAMPPRLVGRSVFFRNLQGPPFSYEVFEAQLPHQPKGKAQVQCCPCGNSSALAVVSCVPSSSSSSLQAPTPSGQQQLQGQAAAALGTAQGVVYPQPATGSNPSGLPRSPAQAATTLLSLCCKKLCGSLYGEQVARWQYGEVHPAPAVHSPAGSGAGGAAAAGHGTASTHPAAAAAPAGPLPTGEQTVAAPGLVDGGASSAAGSGRRVGSSSGAGSDVGLLPLPDVEQEPADEAIAYPTYWDIMEFQEDCLALSAETRSQAMYAPFAPNTWLQPCTTRHLAAGPSPSFSALASRAFGSGPQLPQATATPSAAPAPAAAEALTGLWRGTYGAHGVELVLLQLLQTPPGYSMWQQHQLPQPPPSTQDECLPGLLLQSVLHQPTPAGDLTGGAGEQEQQQEQEEQQQSVAGSSSGSQPSLPLASEPEAAAGLEADRTEALQEQAGTAAAAAAGTSAGGSHHNSSQQQQDQHAGEEGCAFQAQQQLLVVASKVTGDRNVPAGQVTFAVDLGSRSRAGAGQLLQLPPGVHSAVEVNGPGTRPLVIKERYNGLAQIADTNFSDPRITPVELVVFEDPSCLGALWAPPMHNFSFFVRQPGLP